MGSDSNYENWYGELQYHFIYLGVCRCKYLIVNRVEARGVEPLFFLMGVQYCSNVSVDALK